MLLQTLTIPLGIGLAGYAYLFISKRRRYRELTNAQTHINQTYQPQLRLSPYSPTDLPDFRSKFISISDFLPKETFERLRAVALRQKERLKETERTYLPTHKKGGTVSYEQLHDFAPEIIAFYQSPELHAICSAIVGEKLVPTPISDQSSCSLLCYEKAGDHINWHFDHNFYNGRHFTVLLPLVNENRTTGELSSAQLFIQQADKEIMIPTVPNSLIMFEGAEVLHKVSRLGENEQRIVLSMTLCTIPRAKIWKQVARRIKDTAFFGIRALWS